MLCAVGFDFYAKVAIQFDSHVHLFIFLQKKGFAILDLSSQVKSRIIAFVPW